jgi:hypothetical protein
MKNLLSEVPVWMESSDQIKKLNFKSLWIDYSFGQKYEVSIKVLENESLKVAVMIELTPPTDLHSKSEIEIISNVRKYLDESTIKLIQNIRVKDQDILLLNLEY